MGPLIQATPAHTGHTLWRGVRGLGFFWLVQAIKFRVESLGYSDLGLRAQGLEWFRALKL